MMNKYNNNTIYIGNLIKNVGNNNTLYKKDVLFLYDENTDAFYSYYDTFNLFLSRDLDNLTKEELTNINKKIKQYMYNYRFMGIDGEVYVDENSVQTFIYDENKVNKK